MTEDALSDAADEPGLETTKSLLWTGASDGSLALAGGGAFVLAGVRSVARGRFRAIGQLALGGGLLKLGQYQRRNRDGTAVERALAGRGALDGGGEDETATDQTDGKAPSDEAHAATERHDLGRVSQTDEDGDVSSDAEFGTSRDDDSESEIEFTEETDAEPRDRPGIDAEDDDPRRNTGDERVEIDVSDSALADEPAEATGPDPEQAQPSQTEGTEPEGTIEEDASHMRADTPDERGGDEENERGEESEE
ncbi:hypothetical protein [Halostagnicola sp. A-GB9-2]|uniref:hypothetical protein n=1 Tax=Halostagnicola sp. A-GB9-2 TaxID=3048066 RepID=UPI0024BFB410|nr:hypothetical protein [Halostagnicola sp. A-GB9-2]MDJ1432569.1 hypothetical protein [Halostagnicola sp. A-GB9-2]